MADALRGPGEGSDCDNWRVRESPVRAGNVRWCMLKDSCRCMRTFFAFCSESNFFA